MDNIYYWNKNNFLGLLQAAELLAQDSRLEYLADYCRFRERGLRKKAFAALDLFLQGANAWSAEDARLLCVQILELHERLPEVHQFLSQPIYARLIFPVLERWVKDKPNDQTASRWLGLLRDEYPLLEHALSLNPEDTAIRRRLINKRLANVDFATHHLSESRLLAEVHEIKAELEKAQILIEQAPTQEVLQDLVTEIELDRQMLQDWEEFSKSKEDSFPGWCARHRRSYNWPIIVYYNS